MGEKEYLHMWFQQNKRVIYQETDRMGVVHHANYVTWFEIARTEWMRAKEIVYRELEEKGLLLPVLNVTIDYGASAYYDDCIAIFTKVSKANAIRLQFAYDVRRIKAEEMAGTDSFVDEPFGEKLTSGTTDHMWVNKDWKPVRIHKTFPDVYDVVMENEARK